jgi:hypothetical protein
MATNRPQNTQRGQQVMDLQQMIRTSEPTSHLSSSGLSKTTKSNPPIFLNDDNSIWEDWHTNIKMKIDCDTKRNEKEKMGYVLEDLAEAFNDPNKNVPCTVTSAWSIKSRSAL